MASSSSAFLRAMSPMAASMGPLLEAVPSADGSEKRLASQLHRQSLLGAANSVDDVVALVPRDYRDILRPLLLQAADMQNKLSNGEQTLQRLRDHKSRGTFPQHLRSKVPPLQLTKEYAKSDAGAKQRSEYESEHSTYMVALLDKSISAKTDEVRYLRESMMDKAINDAMATVINTRYAELRQRGRVPRYTRNVDSVTGVVNLIHDGFVENPIAVQLWTQCLEDGTSYVERVRLIVEGRHQAEAAKLTKKKEVIRAADVVMADATGSTPSTSSSASIEKIIEKRVKEEVRKNLASSSAAAKKKSGAGKVSAFLISRPKTNAYLASFVPEGQEARRKENVAEVFPEHEGRGSTISPAAISVLTEIRRLRAEGLKVQEEQEAFAFDIDAILVEAEEDGQGEGTGQVSVSQLGEYQFGNAASLPDYFLTVPLPRAISYVISRTPIEIVEASRFMYYVHRSPGVTLPDEISFQLSVGMRFMYHQPTKSSLIWDSWMEFQRRLRWRLKFEFEGKNEFYDPDYDCGEDPDENQEEHPPPTLPYYLELGLVEGRKFVRSTMSKVPDEDVKLYLNRLGPHTPTIRDCLLQEAQSRLRQ